VPNPILDRRVPADEFARLQALEGYHILATPAEPAFDDLAALAARITGTPIALVTLVGGDRVWFKARVGLDEADTSRPMFFCARAILARDLLVVADAVRDEQFSGHELVAGEAHIRFYAGVPLVSPAGYGLGTLCVLDRVPRSLTSEQQSALTTLARQAMHLLELRRLQVQCQEQEQQLVTILDALPSPVILVDAPEAHIVFQNRAAREALGWDTNDPDELTLFWRAMQVLTADGDVVPPERWPARRALRGESLALESLVFVVPNGRRFPVLSGAAPIIDDAGSVVGAVVGFQNVTHGPEMNRLKDDFIALVSHELRTPLTSMRGSLQLLMADEHAVPNPEFRQLVDVALDNTNRLVRMVNDTLDVAQIEAGRMPVHVRRTALADVLTLVINTVQTQAGAHRVLVEAEVSPDLPPVTIDVDRIVQAISNVVAGAIKSASAGTTVRIDTASSGASVSIHVRYLGAGIPEADLPRVFDKFHQIGRSGDQGTGLGLTIAKALVEQHGGRISVMSQPVEGTTFTIELPADRQGA
jgi:signal transduction histidine kinase